MKKPQMDGWMDGSGRPANASQGRLVAGGATQHTTHSNSKHQSGNSAHTLHGDQQWRGVDAATITGGILGSQSVMRTKERESTKREKGEADPRLTSSGGRDTQSRSRE